MRASANGPAAEVLDPLAIDPSAAMPDLGSSEAAAGQGPVNLYQLR